MPRILIPQDDRPKDYKALYWAGVIMNVALPLYEAVALLILYF